jgi:membrane-bound serine protease (ClpP class)
VEEYGAIIILYLIGTAVLVAEIFIPSHGLLGLVGVTIYAAAIYMTFRANETAGYIALLATLIFLPTMALLAVKYWHRTPIGRKISPPNPVLTPADTGDWETRLSPFVGKVGRAASSMRPVGTCVFDGERLECIAEMGVIERNTAVKAIAVKGRNLSVIPLEEAKEA